MKKRIYSFISIYLSFFNPLVSAEIATKPALRLNISQEFHQKDPRKVADLTSSSVHFLLHEGLMKMSPNSKAAIYAIAKEVQIDHSKTVYRFILHDRFYSTGEKITAYDFEKSWKEILHPHFNCPNVHLFYPIKNAKKIKLGLLNIQDCGIRAIDETTLEVTLEHPFPPFLEILAFSTFIPFKSESHFSGPFQIDQFILQQEMTLIPNQRYPHQNGNLPPAIKISFIKDEMTAFNLYEKGELDLIGTPFTHIPKDAIEFHREKYKITTQPNCGICYLICNRTTELFQKTSIHLDILQNISRGVISKQLFNTAGSETVYMIPDQIMKNHLPLPANPSSPVSPPTKQLKLIYPLHGNYPKLAQFIEQELQSKWKIKVLLQGLEQKYYYERLQNKDFDLALATFFAQYQDPLCFLERFYYPDNPKNIAGFDSKSFRCKIDEANFSINETTRLKLLQEAEQILLTESGIIPLFQTQTTYAIKDSIKGVEINSTGGFNFENASMQ
jgi:oligopeptide transport system substrate-binding protein